MRVGPILRASGTRGSGDNNHSEEYDPAGYEYAEEAVSGEPLKYSKEQLLQNVIESEYSRLCSKPIDGMYVIPSANDQFQWLGLIFLRAGIYSSGIFRFTLSIPPDFPSTKTLPTVTFDIDIFHPLIDLSTHELSISRYFPDGWKRDKHHLYNVLLIVQRVFFSLDFDTDSCPNPEAAILWKEDREKYKTIVQNKVRLSRAQVYEDPKQTDDAHALRLTPWDSSIHEPVRQKMMLIGGGRSLDSGACTERRPMGKRHGFSWVDTERMMYLSEPLSARLQVDDPTTRDRALHGIERLDLSGVTGEESIEGTDRSDEQLSGDSRVLPTPSSSSGTSTGESSSTTTSSSGAEAGDADHHRRLGRTLGVDHLEANEEAKNEEDEQVDDV